MKNIFTGIFLLVSACFMQAQTPNYYRNPDKIYLDSKEGHNGSFTWQMHKADETKDPAHAGNTFVKLRADVADDAETRAEVSQPLDGDALAQLASLKEKLEGEKK